MINVIFKSHTTATCTGSATVSMFRRSFLINCLKLFDRMHDVRALESCLVSQSMFPGQRETPSDMH